MPSTTGDVLKLAAASYTGYALYSNFVEEKNLAPKPIRAGSPKVLIIGAGFSGICM
jgi:hypothetical protein